MKKLAFVMVLALLILGIAGTAQAKPEVTPYYVHVTCQPNVFQDAKTYTYELRFPSHALQAVDSYLVAHSNHGQYIYVKGTTGKHPTFTFTSDGTLTDIQAFVRIAPAQLFERLNRLPVLAQVKQPKSDTGFKAVPITWTRPF